MNFWGHKIVFYDFGIFIFVALVYVSFGKAAYTVKRPIKDTLNKGQPLYKGHGLCPQNSNSHSADTFYTSKRITYTVH